MKTPLLKFNKFDGLHIVCKGCNRNIELTQTPYKGCFHPIEKQRYKGLYKVRGQRKTRDLKSRDYDEAIKELLDWKGELANHLKFKLPEAPKEVKCELFTDCILLFSDWMENIDVPRQEKKIRSPKYIKETVEYVNRLGVFLENNGYNLNKLTIHEIDKFAIGKYCDYLDINVPNHATFNHNIKALKSFYNCLINEKGYLMPNNAKKIKLKHEASDPRSINDDDFIKLLEVVNEKDSIQIYNKGKKKYSRNMYKPFIKDSFELAAFCGMRIEEVASLKYSDIVLDKAGKILYLGGMDLKFQRSHNWDKSKAPKLVFIPITPELENLLNRMNYKNNLGSDRYLIDGEETMTRASLAKQMSHSFTFFRRKAGLPDYISLRHFRKTFLSKLETQTGLSSAAGYQKTPSVILKNYIDKRVVADSIVSKGFSYFGSAKL